MIGAVLAQPKEEDVSMRAIIGMLALAAITSGTASAQSLSSKSSDRITEAATVLKEIHAVPDKDIPQALWDKASCVIVIPSLKKAAFIIGGEFGKGLMSCRHSGAWSAPIFMELEKGSWGFQIGGESIDLVLLVMTPNAVTKMLSNKVALGADAAIAGGPVGRSAQAATDGQLKAEVLSYSRAQGLFAGIDLSGGILKPDVDDNADLYGKNVVDRDVVQRSTAPPAVTKPFMTALERR
jgi:lipid-binding SYLF domain-containing protein